MNVIQSVTLITEISINRGLPLSGSTIMFYELMLKQLNI